MMQMVSVGDKRFVIYQTGHDVFRHLLWHNERGDGAEYRSPWPADAWMGRGLPPAGGFLQWIVQRGWATVMPTDIDWLDADRVTMMLTPVGQQVARAIIADTEEEMAYKLEAMALSLAERASAQITEQGDWSAECGDTSEALRHNRALGFMHGHSGELLDRAKTLRDAAHVLRSEDSFSKRRQAGVEAIVVDLTGLPEAEPVHGSMEQPTLARYQSARSLLAIVG